MKPTDDVFPFPENGMSTTPRTDAAVYPMNGVEIVWPHFARQLETELSVMQSEFGKMVLSAAVMGDRNVELRIRAEKAEADTARMDWIERQAGGSVHSIRSFIWFSHQNLRDAIDAAMKEVNK